MPLLTVVASFVALAAPIAVVAEGRAVGHPTRLDVTAFYAPAPSGRGYALHPSHLELFNGAADPLTLVAATLSAPTCARPPALPADPVLPPFGRLRLVLEPDPARPCDAGATLLLVTSAGGGRVPLDRGVLRATFAPVPDAPVTPEPPEPPARPPAD